MRLNAQGSFRPLWGRRKRPLAAFCPARAAVLVAMAGKAFRYWLRCPLVSIGGADRCVCPPVHEETVGSVREPRQKGYTLNRPRGVLPIGRLRSPNWGNPWNLIRVIPAEGTRERLRFALALSLSLPRLGLPSPAQEENR
jgi:hypothetical protein